MSEIDELRAELQDVRKAALLHVQASKDAMHIARASLAVLCAVMRAVPHRDVVLTALADEAEVFRPPQSHPEARRVFDETIETVVIRLRQGAG